jgi:hypothetical protein
MLRAPRSEVCYRLGADGPLGRRDPRGPGAQNFFGVSNTNTHAARTRTGTGTHEAMHLE